MAPFTLPLRRWLTVAKPAERPNSCVSRAVAIRGANDNPAPGDACVTDAGAPLPYPSITAEELEILRPLIAALARMGANDL